LVTWIDLQSFLKGLQSLVLLTQILQGHSLSLVPLGEHSIDLDAILGRVKGFLESTKIDEGASLVAEQDVVLRIQLDTFIVTFQSLFEISIFEKFIALIFVLL
jgi:hypothetical protein